MSSPIYTRHHHAAECIDADQVYFTAPREGRSIHYSTASRGNLDLVREYFRLMTDQPRFVVDYETVLMAQSKECHQSLLDMKKAGVFRLPYEAIVVEVRYSDSSAIVSLWEPSVSGILAADPVDVFGYVTNLHEDPDGRYLVVSPSTSSILIADRGGEPWVKFGASHQTMLPVDDNGLIEKTYGKDCSVAATALFTVMLLMATEGIGREVVECERLNKRRVASNKPRIPRHTYLHIKKVYRSSKGDSAKTYDPRRSPRPHWRRGHLRHVRHGAGRDKVKLVYINPRLVAYHGDAVVEEPRSPDYVVKP